MRLPGAQAGAGRAGARPGVLALPARASERSNYQMFLTAWPRALPEQMAAVREALHDAGEAGPADIARRFRRARAASVAPLLATLAALGHAHPVGDGRFAA